MSAAVETMKIMVVDTSTAMLHALKVFSDKQGYESDSFSDPAEACIALGQRVKNSNSDYRCVMLGWPEGSLNIISDLLDQLVSGEHQDLPVLILCQEFTAKIEALLKRRPGTRALLWKDYQAAAERINDLIKKPLTDLSDPKSNDVIKQQPVVSVLQSQDSARVSANTAAVSNTVVRALLLDNAASVNRALRDLMARSGYKVHVAGSVAEGRNAVEKREYDVVVTDFFLRGEGGEEFCRYLESAANLPGAKPVCVVTSSKYSDAIVKRSLSVGAIACLNKDEPTELLFARIDALVNALPVHKAVVAADDAVPEMLELANDPALLIDHEGAIAGLNKKARRLLDDINRRELVGREFSSVVHRAEIVLETPQKAGFLTSSGSEIAVSYVAQSVSIKGDDSGVLLTFNPQPVRLSTVNMDNATIAVEPKQTPDIVNAVQNPVLDATIIEIDEDAGSDEVIEEEVSDLPVEIKTPGIVEPMEDSSLSESAVEDSEGQVTTVDQFTDTLDKAIAIGASGPRHSVLMFDIQLIAATGDRLSLGHSEPMREIVHKALAKLYTREKSLAYLGDGQFGLVLANRRIQDALVLSQKLMRVIPQLVKYLNNMTLVSHGALLKLSDDTPRDPGEVLNKCRRGCARAKRDMRDNTVLVMPVNKYLSSERPKKRNVAKPKAIAE